MSSNAKVRHHEKRNENRTGKESQQEVIPNECLCSPPHTWGKKGMPARVCPERRKVITATDEQNGMKGQTRGNKKPTKERRTREGDHAPPRGSRTHKKSTQTKTKHTHAASWIQVCCMPRYATQRTRDKNGNHANKSKR